jgi:hypothetical protein
MADFRTRWTGYFKALDGNSNGFLEPEDAIICAEVLVSFIHHSVFFVNSFTIPFLVI